MPAVTSRSSSRRRTVSEINMVPFIDVMLVLLIIFMVSAPLITTGLIDLPTVGKSKQRPDRVIELVIHKDESLRLRVDGEEPQVLTLKNVAPSVRTAQRGDGNTPVVISADKNVQYEIVVKVMDVLQRNGVQRVGLSVKSAG
jgi:biopolymer transport protein TolR